MTKQHHRFNEYQLSCIRKHHEAGLSPNRMSYKNRLSIERIKAGLKKMGLVPVVQAVEKKVKPYVKTDAEKRPDEYLKDKFTNTLEGYGGFARNNMATDRYAQIAATKHMVRDY